MHCAYQFGFPTKAIHLDLLQTRKISPNLSLDQFEEYFSRDYLSLNRRTYLERADQTTYRFIHYASNLITRPHEIYNLGVARGFSEVTSPEIVEQRITCYKTTMGILQRGRNGHLPFDVANSSRTIPDREWEDAVAIAYEFGYTAHEIDYLSMSKWYLHHGSKGLPRGFASNYTRIAEIIITRASSELVQRINLDWETDRTAKEYVLAAFKIGIPVADIVIQLHIHGHKIYEVTEKFVEKFLRETAGRDISKMAVKEGGKGLRVGY